MPRLTKSEREKIIIDFVKGKPTPGYEVIELSNGKYQVKEVKIVVEVEEEDQDEPELQEPVEQVSTPHPTIKRRSGKQDGLLTRQGGRQNALELLKQLTAIMEDAAAPDGASARWGDDDEEPNYEEMTYQQPSRPLNLNQNWNRKRLRF